MKRKLLTIISLTLLFTGMSFGAPQKGTMIDSRDGKTYKIVKIGKQVWMAENLNYQTNNSYCYDNNLANCEKYRRLYEWEEALKACPEGWHLPSKREFEILKKNNTLGWKKGGFQVLEGSGMAGTGDGEAGIWYTGGTAFLSSTEDKSNPYGWMPFVFDFYDGKPEFTSMNGNIIGYSVRCLKNLGNVTEEAYSPQGIVLNFLEKIIRSLKEFISLLVLWD